VTPLRRFASWYASGFLEMAGTRRGRWALVLQAVAGWLLGCWLVWRFPGSIVPPLRAGVNLKS